MTDLEFSKALLNSLGKFNNIISIYNCLTRIRVNVVNLNKVDLEAVKKLDKVIGVIADKEQIQIIVGPGKAVKLTNVCNQLLEAETFLRAIRQIDKNIEKKEQENSNDFKENEDKFRGKLNVNFNATMRKISGIFVPIIPAFIACGLLLAIVEILKASGIDMEGTAFGKVFNVIASSVFSILSIVVGYNTAKQFGGDGIIGACLAGIMTSTVLGDVENPLFYLGSVGIYAGLGGVISVLLVSISAAYIQRLFHKFMPNILDTLLTPLLTIAIMSVVALFVLMPFGGFISQGIEIIFKWIGEKAPYLLGLLPMIYLYLVLFGLHHILIPISTELIKSTGGSVLVPAQIMAGGAELGAAIFVYLTTKDKKMKSTVLQGMPIAFFGIDEPLIWGMSFPLKRLFISSSLGGLIMGSIVGVLGITANVPETTGIEASLMCNKKWQYAVCFLSAIVLGFLITCVVGYKETIETTLEDGKTKKEEIEHSFLIKHINERNKNKAKA